MKFYRVNQKSLSECQTTKELWDKVKGDYQGLSFDTLAEFKSIEDNKFAVTFSTDSEDRHLERVYQNFILKNFKKNPVVIDSHNYNSIEHIIGKVSSAKVKDGKLVGDIIFALENPKGLLAYYMAKGGFINTTSIGFIPLEFDEEGNITKSELLEISVVSVPANPEALFEKVFKSIKSEEVIEEDVEEITEEDIEDNEEETEEEAPEEETEEEPEEIEEEETVISEENKTASFYKEVIKMRTDQIKLLKNITDGLNASNPHEKKRKVYKAIRDAFKSR